MSYQKCSRCKEYHYAPCNCKPFLVSEKNQVELNYKETKDYSAFITVYAHNEEYAAEKYVKKYISDDIGCYIDEDIEVIVIDDEQVFQYSVTPQVDIIYNIEEL